MSLYRLAFGKIIILKDDIAELIVDEGVEMTRKMVDDCHEFLIEHLKLTFSLLVNNINSYAYSFSAQRHFATIPQLQAVAFVAYSPVTARSIEALLYVPRKVDWNVDVFTDRSLALKWLQEEQERTSGYGDDDSRQISNGLQKGRNL